MICGQKGTPPCGRPATHTFWWPGGSPDGLPACPFHAAYASKVADAMGFHLRVEELPRASTEPALRDRRIDTEST